MKETLFILLVILVLLGWSLLRYRKQLASIIQTFKVLKGAAANFTEASRPPAIGRDNEKVGIPLVNCSSCGIWTPQNRAIRLNGSYYCGQRCLDSAGS